ncbi:MULTISPECIES: hypothetical protein [Sphingomonadaceae]|jgi:hypothetical protein|nr:MULTISPECIES: hypothetical protein [Sphingomonadaceae]
MRVRKNIIMSIAAFTLAAFPALSTATTPMAITYNCQSTHGRPDRPLVSTYSAAEAIFLAVEPATNPHADSARFPEISVREKKWSWEVFRWNSRNGDRDSQLAIRIDRCSGEISNVEFGLRR